MQRFDRSFVPPPSLLQGPEASAGRQALARIFLAEPTRRAQTRALELSLDLDEASVHVSLSRLFRGKCAFCERAVTTSHYRFRPGPGAIPAERAPDAHLYYIWLSSAWENIYSICEDCRPDRPEYFPVRGRRSPLPGELQLETYVAENQGTWPGYPLKERHVLLDPCERIRLADHLSVDLSGELSALTERGRETIAHFKLNRPQLFRQRGRKLKVYFDELIDIGLPAQEEGMSSFPPLLDFAALEFGGLWYLLCRRIVLELSPTPVAPRALSSGRICATLRRVLESLGNEDWCGGLETRLAFPVVQRLSPTSEPAQPLPREYSSLASIHLSNFKGIEALELLMPPTQETPASSSKPARPALLILGENAAGKSSILEATALALCSEEARAQLPVDVAALPLDPELLGAGQMPRCTSATVALTFQDGSQRELTIAGGDYWLEGAPITPPVFAYGAFRQYQKQVRRYSPGKSIINLFDATALLSNPEKWLLGLKQVEFDGVVRTLRDILSIEGEFEVMERDFENQRCLIVTAAAGSRALCRTPLSLASSGYRSVLAMVCDIIQGLMNRRINPHFESLETAQAVVLIDEVEAHLHPRWKIQIMGALRSALPNVTFIATTHDPLCLRGMREGEVIVMQRVASEDNPDSDWPVMVEQVVRLPNVSQLTIEQLLTSDFFSLTSTDQPDTERELAMFADLLAAREQGQPLSDAQQQAWSRFERDISDALPVGATEVQRLVQEAVVEYLQNRRQVSALKLGELRKESKKRILAVLEGI
ncbi:MULTISPECIES: AAA family ATPase [unclassified Pseudomonas]|uniref:AAA family ATPase n=1 Tax=unclassified Pseudomonas TaxID=196821 RepID=UPI00200DBC9A|nr:MULTISPECIES: AAA family ATPase [unclassified Pseudomonas]